MIYNLQLLRFLAAFAVLCAHLILFGNSKYGLSMPQLEDSAGFMMMRVDIFFIISGFIMVYTSALESKINPRAAISHIKKFYLKRITRIYPVWWLLCLMLLPVFLFAPTWINSSVDVPTSFLHSLFLIPHEGVPLIVVGWTLEYELFFYLCFGLTLWLGRNLQVLALTAAAVSAIIWGQMQDDIADPFLSILTSRYLLYFAAGMIIALLYRLENLRKYFFWIALAALPIALFYTTAYEYKSIDRVTHFMPLSLTIFLLFLGLETKNIIASKSFYKWGGNISYALYLVHILVIAAAGRLYLALRLDVHIPFFVLGIVIGAGALIAASILYYLFEAPLLKALRKASHVPT